MYKNLRRALAVLVMGAVLSFSALAQQDEKLGKVSFPTSCDPKVQAEFERGVAMLHSYWFNYARKTFEGVLQAGSQLRHGVLGRRAWTYLGNTLVGHAAAGDAQTAWEALEKARAIGAKTQRERDWIEALSAYYRDHDKVAGRQAAGALQQRHGADHAALSRRLRSPGVLCADAAGVGVACATRPTPSSSSRRPSSRSSTSRTRSIRACRISSFMPMTSHRSRTRELPPRGAMPASRRRCRTPGTCPRTSTRWWGCGRNRSNRMQSALEIQPDYYHAADFAVYAHLQLAQDAKAKALIDKSLATADRGDRPIIFVNFTAQSRHAGALRA